MKKTALVSLLSALVLVGCACPPRLPDSHEERSNPKVTVEGGRVMVKPRTLYFLPNERGEITWQLPAGSKFRFPPNGIVIEGRVAEPPQTTSGPASGPVQRDTKSANVVIVPQEEIVCPRQDGGLKFTCNNRHTQPGVYKYTIRVRDGATELELDPFIMNM